MVDAFVRQVKAFLELWRIGPWDPSYLNGTVAFLGALSQTLDRCGGLRSV